MTTDPASGGQHTASAERELQCYNGNSRLVTPIQRWHRDMSALIDGMPAAISGYLTARPEFGRLMGGSDPRISEPLMKEWLDRTIAGPFDGELADFVREISHIGDKEVTYFSSGLSSNLAWQRRTHRWAIMKPPSSIPTRS